MREKRRGAGPAGRGMGLAGENRVEGIFFDYGGVIENLEHDDLTFRKGIGVIGRLLRKRGIDLPGQKLEDLLRRGQERYEQWYWKNNHTELPNQRIWTRFFLKEICTVRTKGTLEDMAEELSSIYEYYLFKRRPSQDLGSVIRTLFTHGYTLALVSNTMSRTLIPERLNRFGVRRYFAAVILSMNVGVRKPRREIFELALKETGLPSQRCVYVGDTLYRDVAGSRGAGFYRSILMRSGITDEKDRAVSGELHPDFTIQHLEGLLDRVIGGF